MSMPHDVVFLLDVNNTLLDNGTTVFPRQGHYALAPKYSAT
jgi:hypothetical protein